MRKLYIVFAILSFVFTNACTNAKAPLNIVISKGAGSKNYDNYANWIKKIDSTVICNDLYHISLDSAILLMERADGLLLSGGPDVHPGVFGKAADTALCDIDLKRDTLEFKLIEIALRRKMPILAICRGEQIMNIALGGDLIVDIPTQKKDALAHKAVKSDARHWINIDKNTLLYQITGQTGDTVNSAHHQALGALSPELTLSAQTNDGIAEAYEWKSPQGKSPMIAVQWHPERLEFTKPTSYKIGEYFLSEVKKYSKK